MPFNNSPKMTGGERIRWVHQPLTLEHFGIHAAIKEDGKVKITKVADEQPNKEEIQYDELEVPAAFIFRLASALKMTRHAEPYTPASHEKKVTDEVNT